MSTICRNIHRIDSFEAVLLAGGAETWPVLVTLNRACCCFVQSHGTRAQEKKKKKKIWTSKPQPGKRNENQNFSQ